MSNLNEQIIKTVNNHINDVCKDYEETTVLLESLPIVVGLKKRIIELEKEVLVLKRQLLINSAEKIVEDKIEKILTKNINLEVIEKKISHTIVSEEDIEKEVDKKDPASLYSGGLWDFNDDEDNGEAYVYESEEQNTDQEYDNEEDENDIDGPILAQLKALGLNTDSIKEIEDKSNVHQEITSNGTIDEDEEEDRCQLLATDIINLNREKIIDTGNISEEDDEELVGAEKWAVEMIKREQGIHDNEEEEDEEEEDEEEEVEEIEIDGEMYYTTDKMNGIIYEYLKDEEVGDEVGHLEDGILFLS